MTMDTLNSSRQNEGDVLIFDSVDDGNIFLTGSGELELLSIGSPAAEVGGVFSEVGGVATSLVSGDIITTVGFESAVYLALFGGNLDDPAISPGAASWWGNIGENDINTVVSSRFQYLLNILPNIPANLSLIESAALIDLTRLPFSATVSASIPKPNTISVVISIESGDSFSFIREWATNINS